MSAILFVRCVNGLPMSRSFYNWRFPASQVFCLTLYLPMVIPPGTSVGFSYFTLDLAGGIVESNKATLSIN